MLYPDINIDDCKTCTSREIALNVIMFLVKLHLLSFFVNVEINTSETIKNL